jgi:hypothetical protein
MSENASEDDVEQPDLDEEQYVEVPDDVAEKVADADDTDVEDAVDQVAEEEAEDADDEGASIPPDETDVEDISLGHVYCQSLGAGATLAKEKYGEGVDGDFEENMERYAALARQCDLDTYLDQWADQHGGSEMTPAQGVMVGTAMFVMSVAATDAKLAGNAMEAAR